ncbi:hypothetical protein [Candidatus Blastococcus massiliensis]|uniref:hypothetical protein n=1 Tax=Candidatus Blastococcus massiliensis TaxID=1470358 RepID=UPI0004AF9F97|nr:hypothetical protein [Candidatus Blastococcus massiliensis]
MPENSADEQWTCDLCGRATPSPSEGGTALTLEVSGRRPDGEWGDWYVGFCTQEHAAEWLSRPLPPPPGSDDAEAPPTSWADRAALTGCALVLLGLLALAILGAWTAADFLLHRT